eukprot:872563-Pelagomonas_calceolata.AAC.2
MNENLKTPVHPCTGAPVPLATPSLRHLFTVVRACPSCNPISMSSLHSCVTLPVQPCTGAPVPPAPSCCGASMQPVGAAAGPGLRYALPHAAAGEAGCVHV